MPNQRSAGPTEGGAVICRVHDCQRQAKAAHGMCWGHYQRWYRYGHPLAAAPRETALDRVLYRTNQSEVGCWLYDIDNAERAPRAMADDGRVVKVSVILWESEHGPLPERARLDSECGVRLCVRPDHHRIRFLARSAA